MFSAHFHPATFPAALGKWTLILNELSQNLTFFFIDGLKTQLSGAQNAQSQEEKKIAFQAKPARLPAVELYPITIKGSCFPV